MATKSPSDIAALKEAFSLFVSWLSPAPGAGMQPYEMRLCYTLFFVFLRGIIPC